MRGYRPLPVTLAVAGAAGGAAAAALGAGGPAAAVVAAVGLCVVAGHSVSGSV
ncbi:hypothetical protein GCM10010124_12220 [Pilimelia terevasa]|uniref:Uncharacterized protein n=1 Tax=Pilimelia terevasa TaxID=53372 RepID=A0A8J3BH54_9ACTN|nr:hypothetical protein [Pilimelia terevasa]GGK21289.1 hypothetical protein GCM10010124_12220 [Pilimelia terevasa]